MKKTRKINQFLLFIFIFACVITSFSVNAFAVDTQMVIASSEFLVHQGETFTTTIYIPDNANIVDFDFTAKYDTSLLTLVKAEENEDIKGTVVFNADLPGEIAINYSRTSSNVNKYLPVLDLTFKVDDNIGIGSYEFLSIDKTQSYVAHSLNSSGKLDRVDFSCDFSRLVIYEVGDVDLSETVDIGDATYIRRHLAGFEGSILDDFKLSLADTYSDESVDIADAVCLQRHLARLDVLYGDRVNVTFLDINGEKYATKSVVYDGTLYSIPAVPKAEGYNEGVWSQSKDEYIAPNYSNLTKDITLYPYYDGKKTSEAVEYYKRVLTDQYYSGDMPTNLSSNLNLWQTINYQSGYYANLVWSSDCNYVLNSTTGEFTKPTYPKDMKLTAKIISYDDNGKIEAEDSISFDYAVPGEFVTPTKAAVEDFLKHYFRDESDGKYRINYDVKLIAKLNNTVIPTEGALYDSFEIRLDWYQNVNGTLVPVNQIKRTASSQINDYIAVATFNGKPLEGDGKIYIDNVEVTPIQQIEIKNHIINEISANMGTHVTNGVKLWNNDAVYGTKVTWETGNNKIAYVANNEIQLKDDAVSGSTLPLNARVSYAVDGGIEEFVLSYNLTVSCNNTIIKAPENMDPELYKAIKAELEDKLGYRGDLTSAALSNVKFVNLDLSDYPEISSLRGLSYCTNLRTLNISGLHITDGTMNQISTLSYLEAFIARGCGLDNLSDGGTPTLKNAVNLRLLDLTDNNFTSLNSVFANGIRYGKLREVYLSKNKLTDINALSRAPMMTYLSLSENGLTTAGTASIANYPYLTYLSLADNQIESVEHLKNLKYLKELRLHNNKLSNVNDLRRLVNLQILYLGHNNIKDIGNLNTLTQLEILYVNDNQLFDISALRDLTKLQIINVSNNKLNSLSVLNNYKATLTEVYAENNNVTDFSFINSASKLHMLLLGGNKVELAQENMTAWLSGLTDMEVLTLSGIKLSDLSFLDSMSKLVRLDVANCGLHAFSGEISNVRKIADRYATLKILDISNNDLTDGEAEILALRNATLLTVLYADNICKSLDAYTLTYSMTELMYISLENCGITTMNWLYKFNNLVYVDLANNDISDVNIESYISNASIKTLKELYLDTNVPCSFANAYRVMDFNVEKLSLKGITVGKVEHLPKLDEIQYLNLDNTGLNNLTGEDPELADLYSVERYKSLKTLDISNNNVDISTIEKMPSIKTVYSVGTTQSKHFYENNLHSLQRLYNRGTTCYLYDKNTKYNPVAVKEGTDILNLIEDFSCDITVAADNIISDNNPFIIDEINDYDITWTVSNSKNYEVIDNHLSVKSYEGIEDETLIVTASIKVYPDQETVSREFTVNTHILRATADYYQIDATGYSNQLTRDSAFSYVLSLKAVQTEGFTNAVKPVEDSISYRYTATTESGKSIPYPNVIAVDETGKYRIQSGAPLGSTVVIYVGITHTSADGRIIEDITPIEVPVTIASRTFKVDFVLNGGSLFDSNGVQRTTGEYVEDSMNFEGLTFEKPGYTFEGWYLDEAFTQLFSLDGSDAVMPSRSITLHAKWQALSYNIIFDANGGNIAVSQKQALSDVAIGDLPTPTRQYYTFDGWFTEREGGEKITAESKFARTDDITLYAYWTLNSFIVNFDANGGSCDKSNIRGYCGKVLGALPTPTKDYYTFKGWFTDISNGTQVTDSSMYTTANDITVYAHWEIHPEKGWIKSSELPNDAQVINRKYSYTQRLYASSDSSSMSGWTKYDTKRTSWGAKQGPVDSNPSNGARNVWSESYVTSSNYKTVYKYFRYAVNYTGGYGSYVKSSKYPNYYEYIFDSPLGTDGTSGGYTKARYWYNNSNYISVYELGTEQQWVSDNYGTHWYYQEPIYTYYYYKDEAKESATYPSGDNISNIQEWVMYRDK